MIGTNRLYFKDLEPTRTQEKLMKITAVLFGLSLFGMSGVAMLAASAAEAKPGGCLKYGAAGAVAGHYVKDANGHRHAVKGAIAGCIAGMVRRHEYNKHQKELKKQEQEQKPMGDDAGGAGAPH